MSSRSLFINLSASISLSPIRISNRRSAQIDALLRNWLAMTLPRKTSPNVALCDSAIKLRADGPQTEDMLQDASPCKTQADRVKTGLGGNAGEPSCQTCPHEILAGQAG